MNGLIQQLITQIEEDQAFSPNTKSSYKSDLNELLNYITKTGTKLQDINQHWVKNYLNHLEETNKERNSYNRRSATFRIFLRFLYKLKLLPANYSLIVNNRSITHRHIGSESEENDLRKIINETRLRIDHRLILLFIGKLGLSGTQLALLCTHQVDFENKAINVSDTEKVYLPDNIFVLLREYLLEYRSSLPNANLQLNLFLDENGNPINETEIYKLIKKLSTGFSLDGKLTTRTLKKLSQPKGDILSMQTEVLKVIKS